MAWRASDQEAVDLCREWMAHLGATDVVAATGETRQICDLYSAQYLAWVDNERSNLGVELVNRAGGTAVSDGRRALIFIQGGVYPGAQDLADSLGVALFQFDSQGGELDGVNVLGRQLRASGLTHS